MRLISNKKSLLLILISAGLFLITNCTKQVGRRNRQFLEADTSRGKISFIFNGEVDHKFSLNTGVINDIYYVNAIKTIDYVEYQYSSNIFYFRCRKKEIGKLQRIYKYNVFTYDINSDTIPNMANFYTKIEDGEATCEEYIINEQDSLNNWVLLTKQINNYSEVWGKFRLSMKRVNDCEPSNYYKDGDAIIEGDFHSR